MSAYVNPDGQVVSSTKLAMHTAGRVYSIVLSFPGQFVRWSESSNRTIV